MVLRLLAFQFEHKFPPFNYFVLYCSLDLVNFVLKLAFLFVLKNFNTDWKNVRNCIFFFFFKMPVSSIFLMKYNNLLKNKNHILNRFYFLIDLKNTKKMLNC